jgi:hypothetical protein
MSLIPRSLAKIMLPFLGVLILSAFDRLKRVCFQEDVWFESVP